MEREVRTEAINEERNVDVSFKPPYQVEKSNTATGKWNCVAVKKG